MTNRIKSVFGMKDFFNKWCGHNLHPGGSLEKAHYNVCDMLSQTATRKARDFSRPWNGQGVMAMQ